MMKRAIISGKKTSTTRIGIHGKVGDTFKVYKTKFRIIRILRMPLGKIFTRYYKQEGFDSSEEFKRVWTKFRPYKKYWPMNTKARVYVFEKLGK